MRVKSNKLNVKGKRTQPIRKTGEAPSCSVKIGSKTHRTAAAQVENGPAADVAVGRLDGVQHRRADVRSRLVLLQQHLGTQ